MNAMSMIERSMIAQWRGLPSGVRKLIDREWKYGMVPRITFGPHGFDHALWTVNYEGFSLVLIGLKEG